MATKKIPRRKPFWREKGQEKEGNKGGRRGRLSARWEGPWKIRVQESIHARQSYLEIPLALDAEKWQRDQDWVDSDSQH